MTPDALPSLALSLTDDISTVAPEEWNRLALRDEYSPFLEHEFLLSVERSRCACPDTGWYPRHFLLRDSRKLIAAAPAYIKTHSMGEFISIRAWPRPPRRWARPTIPSLLPHCRSPLLRGTGFSLIRITRSKKQGKFSDGMRQLCSAGGLDLPPFSLRILSGRSGRMVI